jgi:hypothetical protein
MKKIFIVIGLIWTISIVVNLISDLLKPEIQNYFSIFFCSLSAVLILLVGDLFIFAIYMVISWTARKKKKEVKREPTGQQ